MMNKKHLVATAVVVGGLAVAATFGTRSVLAAHGTNRMDGLVTAIAQKFNLNSADVQKVFEEQHALKRAEHEQLFADKLKELVTAGTLTQEQADKITAKKAELEAQHESLKASLESMTKEQRKEAMRTHMQALKQWATDNNIPLQYLRFMGPGFIGHMKAGMHRMHE